MVKNAGWWHLETLCDNALDPPAAVSCTEGRKEGRLPVSLSESQWYLNRSMLIKRCVSWDSPVCEARILKLSYSKAQLGVGCC
jgi:hypothetical protein